MELDMRAGAGRRGMECGEFMGRNNFKTFEASLDSAPIMELAIILSEQVTICPSFFSLPLADSQLFGKW